MAKIVIILLVTWAAALLTSNTLGGLIHFLPVIAALVGAYAFWQNRQDPPPKRDEYTVTKSRSTWKV